MSAIELQPTRCAICGTLGNATELYPANFDETALNAAVFSARRLPDGIRYRMVTCNTCDLVRSDPVANLDVLAELYRESSFDYDEEVSSLKHTYGRSLAGLTKYSVHKGSLLEIGCGTGFLLAEALAQGYQDITGVEPSVAAVAQASPRIQPHIVRDIMRPNLFRPDTFDVICLFQVFDHIPDPGTLLDECWRVLKPGGLMLCINHNVEAVSARLLKDRSPIIDIEHTFLYSPATMKRIFIDHGFTVHHVDLIWNRCRLSYLTHLAPLSTNLKRLLLSGLERLQIGRLPVSVPLGNLELVARKGGP